MKKRISLILLTLSLASLLGACSVSKNPPPPSEHLRSAIPQNSCDCKF